MESYVKVHPKYMVVIPKEIREKAHLSLGDKLVARFKRGEIVLTPTKETDPHERVKAIRRLRGLHKSVVDVPDEVIFDPLSHLRPGDIEKL
jgi:AbrB family looped-hinge helix DNA binding protein